MVFIKKYLTLKLSDQKYYSIFFEHSCFLLHRIYWCLCPYYPTAFNIIFFVIRWYEYAEYTTYFKVLMALVIVKCFEEDYFTTLAEWSCFPSFTYVNQPRTQTRSSAHSTKTILPQRAVYFLKHFTGSSFNSIFTCAGEAASLGIAFQWKRVADISSNWASSNQMRKEIHVEKCIKVFCHKRCGSIHISSHRTDAQATKVNPSITLVQCRPWHFSFVIITHHSAATENAEETTFGMSLDFPRTRQWGRDEQGRNLIIILKGHNHVNSFLPQNPVSKNKHTACKQQHVFPDRSY